MHRGDRRVHMQGGSHSFARVGSQPDEASGLAQAADLPVKAKAVEYVRICSLYGAGFFYYPGHRHLHQAGRLSARRHHVQRRYLRPAGVERRSRTGQPLSRLLPRPARVWRCRLIPAPPPNTAWSAPSVRPTSSSSNFGNSNPCNSVHVSHRCRRQQRAARYRWRRLRRG